MSESTMPLYFCCDERRRDEVRGTALNGIDYLEVVDHDALPNESNRIRQIADIYILLRYAPQPVPAILDRFAQQVNAFGTRIRH